MDPREIRRNAGVTIEQAAVFAGVSSPTIRLFEANPERPRPDKRAQMMSYYEQLALAPKRAPQRRRAP